MRDHWLVLTLIAAVLVLLGTSTALFMFDPRVNGADALRTGGLAAGSVVALYALWLNDRRSRVQEQRQLLDQRRQELDRERYALEQRRQSLEDRRSDQDRDRVADERFARAVELLGHDTDQVRVGALHALAGLARSHRDYTQTVLDVICSYLRRPFDHPRYENAPPESWTKQERDEAEQQLVVRLTAQRLLTDLLPGVEETDAAAYDLDLTGAALEYFELTDRRVGTLVLRRAHLRSSNNFSRCEFHGPAWFTAAVIGPGRLVGHFRCTDVVFGARAWFSGVRFRGPADFSRTRFGGRTRFEGSSFEDAVWLTGAVFSGETDFRNCRFHGDADLASADWPQDALRSGITVEPDRQVTLPDGWVPDEPAAGNVRSA